MWKSGPHGVLQHVSKTKTLQFGPQGVLDTKVNPRNVALKLLTHSSLQKVIPLPVMGLLFIS